MQMLLQAASANGAYAIVQVLAACEFVRAAGTGGHARTAGQKPPAAAGAAGKAFSVGKKREEAEGGTAPPQRLSGARQAGLHQMEYHHGPDQRGVGGVRPFHDAGQGLPFEAPKAEGGSKARVA